MGEYDIAFSYASEQSSLVEQYKKELQAMGIKVFIDTEHPELFVFNYVPDVLKRIYESEEIAMLIFLSEDYAKKDFTMYESRIGFERLLKGQRIEIIRIDDSTLPWLPDSVHYFDIRKNDMKYICNALCRSLPQNSVLKILNIEELFITISEYIDQNCNSIKKSYTSKECIIYQLTEKENAYIKFNCCDSEKNISIFCSSTNAEPLFSVVEIYIDEKKKSYILYNKGILESESVFVNFPNTDTKGLLSVVQKAIKKIEESL